MRRRFYCEILTPSGEVSKAETTHVRFPASDGQMGIMGGHAPLVARMGAGLVQIDVPDEQPLQYFISGGFAQMHESTLTLLAEECTPLEEMTPEQAWEDLAEARDLPRETPEQEAYREQAIEAARIKFRIVQKVRGKPAVAGAEQEEDAWD
ncbi:MAG: ATP synthase F1 subunit epsilon [Planctomycetota bacterium]